MSHVFNSLLLQESLMSLVGAGLFLAVGLITYSAYSHPEYGAPAGKGIISSKSVLKERRKNDK